MEATCPSGFTGSVASPANCDEDEAINALDPDDDGDGALTLDEGSWDLDGDGWPNHLDQDADGDGWNDADEDPNDDGDPHNDDTDADGYPNYLDIDDDGDGVPTADEPVGDSNDDGTPNHLDATDRDWDGHNALEDGGEDCDDANSAVHPGAAEDPSGQDRDCDGFADPTAPLTLRACSTSAANRGGAATLGSILAGILAIARSRRERTSFR